MTEPSPSQPVSEGEVLEKNREEYDRLSQTWKLAVFEPVHAGWEFTNMGGASLLDRAAREGALGPGRTALDLCCGAGDGCRYLAQHYGCAVDGVEINHYQVSRARQRLASMTPQLAGCVRFIEADILAWEPERRYDLVYSMDSLPLVSDFAGALALARRSLLPSGRLVLADIGSGPAITDEIRKSCWKRDGIANLLSQAEYRAALHKTGFRHVEIENVSALATECFTKISSALDHRREEIVRCEGQASLEEWLELSAFYLRAFEEGELTYLLVRGRPDPDALE